MSTTTTMKPGSTLNPKYPYRSHVTANAPGHLPGVMGSFWVRFVRPTPMQHGSRGPVRPHYPSLF